MGKRVGIKEAAEITGLTEYALRMGARQGRFPHIRIGLGGRILFDIDLLERYLEQEAMNNAAPVSPEDNRIINYNNLRRISE